MLTQNAKSGLGRAGPLAFPLDTDPTEEIIVRKAPILFTALAALALVVPACSDDDGEDAVDTESTDTTAADTGDTEPPDDTATDDTEAPDEGDSACGEPGFEGEISRTADGDHAEGSASGDDIVDVIAYGTGQNYTVYFADHEIDRAVFEEYDSGSFSTDNALVADDGGLLVTMFVRDETEDLATGSEVDLSTYGVIIDTGGGATGTTTGAEGTATITGLDDSTLCFDLTYADELQTIEGTVTAEIW